MVCNHTPLQVKIKPHCSLSLFSLCIYANIDLVLPRCHVSFILIKTMYIIKHDDMTRKSITEKIHNDVFNKRRSVFSTSLDQSRTKIGIVKFRAVVGDDEAETKT